MRRLRFFLATIVLLAAMAVQMPIRAEAAAGPGSYPQTDFTLVTPEDAVLYATLQSTSAHQAHVLSQVGTQIASQPILQGLLGTVLGGSLSGSSATGGSIQQVLTLLNGSLGRIFNSELGLALLPITTTNGTNGLPTPHLHLLLDAGLQPGVTAVALRFGTAVLGIPSTVQTSYRGFSIVSVDLNVLARILGKLANNSALAKGTLIPANGPLSSTFYGAVAGNDAILASDLPSLHAALDTYSNAQPSIAASDPFAEAVGILPGDRFATLYAHLGLGVLGQLLGNTAVATILSQLSASTPGLALSLTAQPHALLLTTSTPPSVRSIVIPLP